MKKFKKSFLYFCVILFSLSGIKINAQQDIDSLKIYYKWSNEKKSTNLQLKDISKVIAIAEKHNKNEMLLNAYNRKSYLFGKIKEYDSAIVYAEKLLQKSIIYKNKQKQAIAYKRLADCYRKKDSFISSNKYYKKYYEISRINKDTMAQIKALRYIAVFEKDLGLTFESESSATKALKLVENLTPNDDQIKAKMALYNHLGILYKERDDYNKAIELYDRALAKAKKASNVNTILNNKANIYLNQKKYDAAINEYTKIYDRIYHSKDTLAIAMVLSNLGLAQSKINNPEGLANMKKALKTRMYKNDIYGKYHSNIHLAEYYKDRNNIKKAKRYANKAYNIAQKLKNNKLKIGALSFLVSVHKDAKVVEYKKMNDSLAKVERTNTNKFASSKYDYSKFQKKEKENTKKLQRSKLKQMQERFYKLLYLAIGLFLLLLLIFTIITLKRKNKKDKQRQVYETETRISQKVHDEVANDVFGIMTKLQVKESENIEILDDLERVYFKTRDISKENSIINFKEDFGIILQDLLVSYGNNQVNVITRNLNKIEWKSLSKLKKTVIYRVLQELMTNMKKHSKASITIVSFSEKNKSINIDYKDNGIGCIVQKNVGLQIVETRIKSIKGTITFESQTNKGFEVKIKI